MRLPESLASRIEAIRQPAYTGDSRCRPCTVVNAVGLGAVTLLLALLNPFFAAVVFGVGAALIYLRGYIVPGTPTIAPALVDPLPFDLKDDEPAGIDSDSLGGDVDGEAIVEALVAAGVLVVREEELYLDETFREEWERRIDDLGSVHETVLADRAAAASHDDVDGEVHGNRILLAGGRDVWLSPAVAIAETAAVETLADWDVPEELRAPAAEPLRTFVRVCPVCGGSVGETTLRRCCGGPGSTYRNPERLVLACADCDTVLLELRESAGPEPN